MESWQIGMISMVLFVVLMFSISLVYTHSQVSVLLKSQEDLKSSLNQQITDLKSAQAESEEALAQLSDESAATKSSLERTRQDFAKSVTDLGGSLESVKNESKSQMSRLSGQLQSVEKESKQKLGEIEKQLLDVNVKSESFAGIIDQTIKSVVSINTDVGTGSGAIIDPAGYIITNRHVVDGATQGAIKTADGVHHPVRVAAKSDTSDLALLQIQGNYPYLTFGSSQSVSIGSRVVAMGSPAGLEFTVSEGIVSAKRTIGDFEYIQTDLSMNPGNSGGPLIDPRGNIVGINTLKLQGFEGLGFALTSEEVSDFALDAVLADKKAQAEAAAQAG